MAIISLSSPEGEAGKTITATASRTALTEPVRRRRRWNTLNRKLGADMLTRFVAPAGRRSAFGAMLGQPPDEIEA